MEHVQPQLALNRPVSLVLVWGFRISASLLLIGLIISAIQQEALHTSLEGFSTIIEEIGDGNGAAVVALSILVMIATPIASTLTVVILSLIHISEPTRRTPISYAVFCL